MGIKAGVDMYINTLNDEMRKTYGKKMYKLSLSGGMTCPNRDGTIGTRGCIFCSAQGSGDFSESNICGISAQIEGAKLRLHHKADSAGYIAYYQSFTNTYAPVEKLRSLFYETINHPDIDILSIATRPDCLGDEVISLLSELNKIKPVWVELGFQSSNEKTAEYIRRGYVNRVFDEAVNRLKSVGITVIVHMIIGLPYETKGDMISTAEYIGKSGADGIKLQLLHVLNNTDLADEYKKGKFSCLSLDEYTDILISCIKVLPPNMVIHRMTGDGAKKELIAPLWSGNKKAVLNYISKRLADENVIQGELYKEGEKL